MGGGEALLVYLFARVFLFCFILRVFSFNFLLFLFICFLLNDCKLKRERKRCSNAHKNVSASQRK